MSFEAVRGQSRPLNLVKQYISEGKLGGAFLFCGPEGIGKKLAAKEAAKALNCLDEVNRPCDQCPSCLKIEKNNHPDYFLIDHNTPIMHDAQTDERADSQAIRIGHIRQLQRQMSLKAYEARSKVFIIDDAHNLTASASNAFLKILEEPAQDSLIILISDKPGLLFNTIRSRCRAVKFSPLKRAELEELLAGEHEINREEAHFLAYFSEGSLGRALKLHDAGIFERKNSSIDAFSSAGRRNFDGISLQKREEARVLFNVLAAWFRDIYLKKGGGKDSEMINIDRLAQISQEAGRMTFEQLNSVLDSLAQSLRRVEQNINLRLLLYQAGLDIWKE